METKTINSEVFLNGLVDLLAELKDSQTENIEKAAEIVADTVQNDGVVHVFGSGHSYGFGVEMANRPGSLVPIHSIATHEMVTRGLYTYADFKDPNNVFERRPGVADQFYDMYEIHPQDCFIIISNSGINGMVIDLALKAKEMNHKVIVVTSMQHTTAEPSRHPAGKKLYEIGDLVIDNCGPRGDALLETGKIEKICSVSSITGAIIAQGIGLGAMDILKERGVEAPVLTGDADHDSKVRAHYGNRI